MKSRFVGVAMVALSVSTSLSAAAVVQTTTIERHYDVEGPFPPDLSRNYGYIFDPFDASLGTLTDVQVNATRTGVIGLDAKLFNNDPPAGWGGTLTLDRDTLVLVQRFRGVGAQFAGVSERDISGFSSGSFRVSESYDDAAVGHATDLALDSFSTANLDIPPGERVKLSILGQPMLTYVGTYPPGIEPPIRALTESYSISLTYVYSPAAAPEPASWAMMISGFWMAGLSARRRRSVHLRSA